PRDAGPVRVPARAALQPSCRVRLSQSDSRHHVRGAGARIRRSARARRGLLHRDPLLGGRSHDARRPRAHARLRVAVSRRALRAGGGVVRVTATTRWGARAAELYGDAYARRYRGHDDAIRDGELVTRFGAWLGL